MNTYYSLNDYFRCPRLVRYMKIIIINSNDKLSIMLLKQ